MPTLLLRLKAPFQSYGVCGKSGERGTAPFPTKSAIIGMVIVAGGYRFIDNEWNPKDIEETKSVIENPTHVLVIEKGTLQDDFQTGGGRCSWTYGSGTRTQPLDLEKVNFIYNRESKSGSEKKIGGYTKPLKISESSLCFFDKWGYPLPLEEEGEKSYTLKYNYSFANHEYDECGKIKNRDYRNQKPLTIITKRKYIINGDFFVVQQIPDETLANKIFEYLKYPKSSLYLGRKCFFPCEKVAYKIYEKTLDIPEIIADNQDILPSIVECFLEASDGNIRLRDIPISLYPMDRKYIKRNLKRVIFNV